MRPRQTRHVHMAFTNGPVRRSRITQPRGLNHRQTALGAHGTRQCNIGCRFEGHAGKGFGQPVGRAAIGPVDVDHVGSSLPPQKARQRDAILGTHPALVALIGGVAQADDKIVTDPVAHRLRHLHQEPRAVFQRAAIGILAQVRQRRQELPQQMCGGQNFATIQAALAAPPGGIRKVLRDALDVMLTHLVGHAPDRVARLAPLLAASCRCSTQCAGPYG